MQMAPSATVLGPQLGPFTILKYKECFVQLNSSDFLKYKYIYYECFSYVFNL